MLLSCKVQHQPSAMYGDVCIYRPDDSSVSWAGGGPLQGVTTDQEWVAWLKDESVHEPLTLNKMQMDMLALLTRWPFDQLTMVG